MYRKVSIQLRKKKESAIKDVKKITIKDAYLKKIKDA